MHKNIHIFFINFLTTKAIWILNCKLNSYPAKEDFSSGSADFRSISLLFSVHFPNWLLNLAPQSAEKSRICCGILRDVPSAYTERRQWKYCMLFNLQYFAVKVNRTHKWRNIIPCSLKFNCPLCHALSWQYSTFHKFKFQCHCQTLFAGYSGSVQDLHAGFTSISLCIPREVLYCCFAEIWNYRPSEN